MLLVNLLVAPLPHWRIYSTEMTRSELLDIWKGLEVADGKAEKAVLHHWDSIGKPIEGLGLYEKLIARIGAIQHTNRPRTKKRKLLLFFSDNGIVESGVSQSDVSVTHKVAEATARKTSTASLMAQKADIELIPIDIGMKGEIIPSFHNCRVCEGSRNFLREKAMTEDETLAAIKAGYDLVHELEHDGLDLVLLGEMGVANTTTSTALGCAILKEDPKLFTGRGAGLSDAMLDHKVEVIAEAIERHGVIDDPLEALATFGGYDIAGMVGSILACAELHVPVILDGLVTLVAALVSERLFPGISSVFIASHNPRERMGRLALETLGLKAPMDADLALGEGTGAILLVPQLDISLELYLKGISFDDLGMDAYTRYGKDE